MRVTVEEIAKIAGVSKATVSRVLNSAPGVGEETRKRVQNILDQVQYSNQSAGLKTYSKSIALMIPDISNPFFSSLAHAVETTARKYGYWVILANTDSSEQKETEYIRNLIAKKVDGLILVPCGSECRSEHLIPRKYRVPMVLLDRKLNGLQGECGVYSDNQYAAFRSCEILFQHGANRIAFISGPMNVSSSIERLEGYQIALRQYRVYDSQELIRPGDYTVESGYNAVIEMERAGIEYSAILAANDLMAFGALNALKELSYHVPEEKELIGFDNILYSRYCEPPLSTIQQPTAEMGAMAVDMLLRRIRGEKVESSIHLQPKLLLRKTTR